MRGEAFASGTDATSRGGRRRGAYGAGVGDRCRLSPGERILALVLNVLTERRPLCAVADPFPLTDGPLWRRPDVTRAAWADAVETPTSAGGILAPPCDPCTATIPRRTGPTG